MARNNYQYEKRQRDIAKKKKQDEKRQKKFHNKPDAENDTSENSDANVKTDEVVKE